MADTSEAKKEARKAKAREYQRNRRAAKRAEAKVPPETSTETDSVAATTLAEEVAVQPEVTRPADPAEDVPFRTRPTAGMATTHEFSSPYDVVMDRSAEATRSGRPPRVSMGSQKKLALPAAVIAKLKDLDMVPHFFLDQEGRLDRLVEAWWVFVKDEYGCTYTRAASRTGGRQVLMAIKKEYYDEEQELKSNRNISILKSHDADQAAGEYGIDGESIVRNVVNKPN